MADKFEVIIGAVDQASPVFQKIKKQLEGVQTSSKNIATGLQSMADKAKWAFAAMSGAVVGAVKVFADFEDAMAKVATQLPGEAIEQFGEMKQAVQDMSVTFGQSTSTMAQGLYDILSAAIEPEHALKLLEQSAITAAAGFTDVATTADLFTSILNAYGMEVDEAARVSDVLFQTVFRGKAEFNELASEIGPIMGIAAQAGVALEDLGAAMATLTRQGISTSEAATAIRQAILSYIDPGREAQETAAALGIEFNATSLQSEGLIRSIGKLTGATQEQLAALFPNVRALIAVQGVLGDLSGAYEDLQLNMDATGTTQEAFEKATDTMKFSIDQLKSSVQVLTQEFVEEASPAIQEIIDIARGFIQTLRDLDDNQKKTLTSLFLNLTKIVGVTAGLGMLNKSVLNIASSFGVAQANLTPWLIGIEALVAGLFLVYQYREPIVDFIYKLGEGLGIASDEATRYFNIIQKVGEATKKTADIQAESMRGLSAQIVITQEKIKELEQAMAPWLIHGVDAPKEMTDEYVNLNNQLDTLIETQKEFEGIIEKEKATQKAKKEIKELNEELSKTPEIIGTVSKEYENALERLQAITHEASWGALIEEADTFSAQMLTVQKQFSETMNEIASMPESLAREKAAAVEAVVREYNTKMRNIEKAAFEASIRELNAYISSGVKAQAQASMDIIALQREKSSRLSELEREYFERTGRDLEILVQKYREKYAEILNSFNWTQDEIKRIQEIATDDLTTQLVTYVEKYIEEMQRAGASSEEVVNAVEGIILVLEKMGISAEIIEQVRTQWELMPAAIEESKEKISELIDLIGDIGDVVIDMQFGDKPSAGTVGGLVGGILGLFSGIPTWIAGIVDLVFGWIDKIQKRTQEMIDSVTGQFQSAMVDFFMAGDLDSAVQNFGQRLNEIIYQMMVDAIVNAIIASEMVQDAAKQLGKAVNEYMKGGTLDALTEAFDEFANFMQSQVIPIMAEVYPIIQQYNPIEATTTTGGIQEFGGSVPSFQSGGYVPYTGLALLHQGEQVIPAGKGGVGDISITVNNYGEKIDGRKLWQEMEYEARRRGLSLAGG